MFFDIDEALAMSGTVGVPAVPWTCSETFRQDLGLSDFSPSRELFFTWWFSTCPGPPAPRPRTVALPPHQPRGATPWQTTPPAISLPGPFGEANAVNLVDAGLTQWIGGAFSFMVTMQMDHLQAWTRIFDFSLIPNWETVGAGSVDYGFDLFFSSSLGSSSTSLVVEDFFELGREVTVLFTISATGVMRVYRDGELLGEKSDGQVPNYLERPHLTVGNHHAGHTPAFYFQGFRGTLRDIKAWTQEVNWTKAPNEPKGRPAVGKGRLAAGKGRG